MSDAIPAGRFIWYELLTSDVAAAVPFYQNIVQWGTQTWDEGEQPYHMWTAHDQPVAGVLTLPDDARQAGAPPHWLGYVSTPDVDAATARVTELDGMVHHVMEIPKVGKFAIVGDPLGAVFAVFTPESPTSTGKFDPKVGQFSWHELLTADHEAAFVFYSELLGWEETDAFEMGELGTYQMFGYDGQTVGGMFTKPPEVPVSAWMYYAKVTDVEAAAEAVTADGGHVLNGPMEVPGGDIVAQCLDPQGAAFAVHAARGA